MSFVQYTIYELFHFFFRFLEQLMKNFKCIPKFLMQNLACWPKADNFFQDDMKFYLIILVLSEKVQMSLLSKVENVFLYVQSGMTQSDACVLKETPVNISTVSALLKCGIHCNALSRCVGVDIIGKEAKRCRLLYGYPALISTHTASDETVRYQKV